MSEEEMLIDPLKALLKGIFWTLAYIGCAFFTAAFLYIFGYWVIGGQIAIWMGVF